MPRIWTVETVGEMVVDGGGYSDAYAVRCTNSGVVFYTPDFARASTLADVLNETETSLEFN